MPLRRTRKPRADAAARKLPPTALAVDRILDANINRAREGLRVAEEVARLALSCGSLQAECKRLRHGVTAAERALPGVSPLRGRDAGRDPGAGGRRPRAFARATWQDLARANLRRAQEALRVLEEVSHLKSPSVSRRFQRLRFHAYELESRLIRRLTFAAGK